jgi:hypothetical protein
VRKTPVPTICCIFLLVSGCDVFQAIAPLPAATVAPTATILLNTATPFPTLGALETLDAAYCLDDDLDNDDHEYNLLRFFPSGVVLEMTVQGYKSCQESWDHVAPYLSETATDTFNHGEYQFSGSFIQFWLAPAGSNQSAGTVAGRYEEDRLILQRQGVEMEYRLIYGGK